MLAGKPIQSFWHTIWFHWHTAGFFLLHIMLLKAVCHLGFKVPEYLHVSLDSILSSRNLFADGAVSLQKS